MRGVLFFFIALAVLAPFTIVTIVTLLRLHPKRRLAIIALAVIGNLMWPFFGLLRAMTPFSRMVRAVLGPPWFAWTCFAILYSVVMTLIIWTPREFRHWVSRVFLTITIAASIAGFYDAIVPLRVDRVPIFIDDLPARAEGTKIALMADMHVGLFTRPSRLRQFFERTGALKPDVVILAGDLIDDDPYFVPKLLESTRSLDPATPLLAVLGNHEMYGDPDRAIAALRGSRIRLLVNEGTELRSLWIAGLSDFAAQRPDLRPDMARALAGAPSSAMPIVVAHQPKAFDEARMRKIPLTLVAHTHGGQLGIRPLGWSLAGVFLPYDMGLFRRGGSQLFVNTGTGFWLIPFRLGMTGEITLIELHKTRPASRVPLRNSRRL
ncbi:MAG TPA: metallophosphoesterase [Thermoanaerobaculia bacterium]|nr:metallophosphoesterase [Thermoanaerobaculia bacterium]